MDELLTAGEVAVALRLNVKTVYRLLHNEKLPGKKIGGSWRFRKVDVEILLLRSGRNHNEGVG